MKQMEIKFPKDKWKITYYQRSWVIGSQHRQSNLVKTEFEGDIKWVHMHLINAMRNPKDNKYIKLKKW